MRNHQRSGEAACEPARTMQPAYRKLTVRLYTTCKDGLYYFIMEVEFDDDDLDRLETDAHFTAGFAQEVVRAYRKRMQQIRAFRDERDFMALKSLHFEKLKRDREGQHSIRLNLQWRLILEIRGSHPCKVVGIIEIVDYH